jgi:hypothetical protein
MMMMTTVVVVMMMMVVVVVVVVVVRLLRINTMSMSGTTGLVVLVVVMMVMMMMMMMAGRSWGTTAWCWRWPGTPPRPTSWPRAPGIAPSRSGKVAWPTCHLVRHTNTIGFGTRW